MNHSLRYTLISLLIVLALSGGWYVLHDKGVLLAGGQVAQTPPAEDPLLAAQAANSAGLSQAAALAASTTAEATFPNVYKNATYGFSFRYPNTLKVGESTSVSSGATTILAQDVAQHIGFQIYITPFTDSDPVITAARVAGSIPNLDMRGVVRAQLSRSSEGVSFVSKDASFGESRQVWVVYKQHLYQISTYSSQDALLNKVLATWAFGK